MCVSGGACGLLHGCNVAASGPGVHVAYDMDVEQMQTLVVPLPLLERSRCYWTWKCSPDWEPLRTSGVSTITGT
ncbi:hypothetical protein GDO81_024144 [Engystomops pustulosus]|nr:hypothetical protein GDO81_024144 [Engystomops pustulosus]